MLPDYKSNLTYTPLKLRQLHFVTIELLFAGGGAVTVVNTAVSNAGGAQGSFTAPNVACALTGTGLYTITVTKGMIGMLLGGSFERNAVAVATSWAAGEASTFALRSEDAVNGSYLLSTLAGSGAEVAPVSGSTLKLCLLIGKI